MPELPEVETVRRAIGPLIQGKRVISADIRNDKIVAFPDAGPFADHIVGKRFGELRRRGKFLIADMDDGWRLVIHLRMTGCLTFCDPTYPEERHTHIVIRTDGGELRFSDMRRFGRMWLLSPDDEDVTGVERLGPEPDDPALCGPYLKDAVGGSRRAIKECILDQSIIAGVGNIYADESLHSAGILPSRPACSLNDDEYDRLAHTICDTILFFTEKNAVTPEEYLESKGRDYRNTPHLRVYGHAGEPCRRCGTVLERTVIGGRGCVYCPACQR